MKVITEDEARKLSKNEKRRLRRRGIYVPRTARRGFTQTQQHINARKRFGSDHHCWLGNNANPKSGRCRAVKQYPSIGPCSRCQNPKSERHHKDGNTLNNSKSNIAILCRRCHMLEDGRISMLVNRNTRYAKKYSREGISLTLSQWSKRLGIGISTLRRRFAYGWSVGKTLSTPLL